MRQRAEGAVRGGVAVAADHRHARQGQSLLGADDVHDPLALVLDAEVFDPELLGVLRERLDLDAAFLVLDRLQPGLIGRHVVVGRRDGAMWRADFTARIAKAFKSLWRRHLMHEMPVDIDQARAVLGLVHHMGVPNLVVKRLGHGSVSLLFQRLPQARRLRSGILRFAQPVQGCRSCPGSNSGPLQVRPAKTPRTS